MGYIKTKHSGFTLGVHFEHHKSEEQGKEHPGFPEDVIVERITFKSVDIISIMDPDIIEAIAEQVLIELKEKDEEFT